MRAYEQRIVDQLPKWRRRLRLKGWRVGWPAGKVGDTASGRELWAVRCPECLTHWTWAAGNEAHERQMVRKLTGHVCRDAQLQLFG